MLQLGLLCLSCSISRPRSCACASAAWRDDRSANSIAFSVLISSGRPASVWGRHSAFCEARTILQRLPLSEVRDVASTSGLGGEWSAAAPDRGRDGHYWPPPAQIRTCPIQASGSCRRYLTRKRCSGHGCRTRGCGRCFSTITFIRRHVSRRRWLRRRRLRYQRTLT